MIAYKENGTQIKALKQTNIQLHQHMKIQVELEKHNIKRKNNSEKS